MAIRAALTQPPRVDLFQLAQALELPPSTILDFFSGSGFQGRKLPGVLVRKDIRSRSGNEYECHLWFKQSDVKDWLNDQMPALLPAWARNKRNALMAPARPLPRTKTFMSLRKSA